jgi:hypothetical protein
LTLAVRTGTAALQYVFQQADLPVTPMMNMETDPEPVTRQAAPWVPRLLGSAMIALAAILIGRWVCDSVTGLFLAEAVLGGFAGWKFGGYAFPGAALAFLFWMSAATLWNAAAFHGEGSLAFLLMLIGTTIFAVSGCTIHFFMKKRDAVQQ